MVSQGRTPLDCLEGLCPATSSGATGRQVPTPSRSLALTTSGAQRTGPGFLPFHSTLGWIREVRSCRPPLSGTPLFPVKDVFQIVSSNNYCSSGERLTSLLTLLLVRLPLRTRDRSGFLRLFGNHPLVDLSRFHHFPPIGPSGRTRSPPAPSNLDLLPTISLSFSFQDRAITGTGDSRHDEPHFLPLPELGRTL